MSFATRYLETRERFNQAFDGFFLWLAMRFRVLVIEVGQLFEFALGGVRLFFTKPYRFDELIVHMEFIGNKSLGMVPVVGTIYRYGARLSDFLGFSIGERCVSLSGLLWGSASRGN